MKTGEMRQREIIDGFIAAYNEIDVETMLGFVHAEIVFRNVSGDEVNAEANGIDELRALANQSKLLFSSRCQRITGFKSDGDTAVVEIEFEGVLKSDLPNGMKAGDTLRLAGRSNYRFLDDKILGIIDYS